MLPHFLDGRTVGWITFTSSSTARNFLTLLGPARIVKRVERAKKLLP